MQEFWAGFVQWWSDLGAALYDYFIKIPEDAKLNNLTRLILAVVIAIVGRWVIKLLMKLLRKIAGIKNKIGVDVSVKTFTLALTNAIFNIGLAIIVLMVLQVDFNSFASLFSSAIVAVGLSLQDLISSFAAGLVLLRSKRFKTGDYIHVRHPNGECEGTVSSIGLLTSTMETFRNQHVIIPNNLLMQSVITDYSTNPTRRLDFEIGVDYSTDTAKCKKVIMDVIQADKRILDTPVPVVAVVDLSEFSITVKVICFTKGKDYWDVFYAIRENILLAFRKNDISIPFRRIVMENYVGSDAEHQAIVLKETSQK